MDEILQFKPFKHIFIDIDGDKCVHTFVCPKCGSKNAIKILLPFGERSFWSGNFMCSDCGTSLCNGEQMNFYSSCFIRKKISIPVQLTLF